MSFIKDFFRKKKMERKFKSAGPGTKLGEKKTIEEQNDNPQKAEAKNDQSPKTSNPSNGQKAAGLAALKRYQQSTSNSDDFEKQRSRAAIRAMAQKEIEKERKTTEEAEKLKTTYGERPVVELEGPSLLGCEGVFYKCPQILGPEITLKRTEMQTKIRNFLYDQLNTEDKGLTACLIIHTLNKDSDKVKVCVDTLCKYLENILNNPTDEKYRKIRKNNQAYINRVSGVEGHDHFLSGCGFESANIDDQEYWIYPTPTIEKDPTMSLLHDMKDAIQTAEPIKAELDRGLRILLPTQASKRVELPTDFFNYSPEELKKEQQARTEAIEQQGMLRTKAMREREEQREKRKYRYTLIRVRFSDGLVLQGTFSVYEKFSALLEYVTDSLEYPLPFVLFLAGKGQIDTVESENKTLLDMGLIPSAILTFNWHPDVAGEVESQLSNAQSCTNEKPAYLKHDLIQSALKERS